MDDKLEEVKHCGNVSHVDSVDSNKPNTSILGEVGVLEVNRAVTRKLNWIFRAQPILDFGIDGVIEQCVNSEPVGKFLAVQIKSGASHFPRSSGKLTYYPSNTHYKYWTNLNIPIIMVAYLPEDDTCYWAEMSSKTFIKTRTNWKLEIPLSNVLNEKSENKLKLLLSQFGHVDVFSRIYSLDKDSMHLSSHDCVEGTIDCTQRIGEITTRVGEYIELSRAINDRVLKEGSDSQDPRFLSNIRKQSEQVVRHSKRLALEVDMFSSSLSEEIFVIQKLVFSSSSGGDRMSESMKGALKEIPQDLKMMRNSFIGLERNFDQYRVRSPAMDIAALSYLENIRQFLTEISSAIEMFESVLAGVES